MRRCSGECRDILQKTSPNFIFFENLKKAKSKPKRNHQKIRKNVGEFLKIVEIVEKSEESFVKILQTAFH